MPFSHSKTKLDVKANTKAPDITVGSRASGSCYHKYISKPDAKANMKALDITVGSRACAYRRHKYISQESLGNACGVSYQMIQKYESGLVRMKISTLYAIAEGLGVSVLCLIPDTNTKALLDVEPKLLKELLGRLPDNLKQVVQDEAKKWGEGT